jgi:hypothetical protein
MKAPTVKQLGFFDPITGLALLAVFGLTGAAIESTTPADSIQAQHQIACAETATTVAQEDFSCD